MAKSLEKNETPNLAGQDQDRDRRAKDFITEEIASIQGSRMEFENMWTVVDRLWRGDPISRYFPTDRTTHVPEPFKVERAATPRIKLGLFPNKEWYRIVPVRQAGANPAVTKALLQEQFIQGHFDARMTTFLQSCVIFGTAIAKVPYVYDTLEVVSDETRRRFTYEDGQISGTKAQRRGARMQKINRDRTELRPLSLFDVYFDWRYDSLQDCPVVIDECRQTKEYCLKMLRDGIYQGITEEEIQNFGQQQPLPPPPGKDLQMQATGLALMKRRPENEILISEAWGLFDIEGNGERVECQMVLLNREHPVVIRERNLWHGQRPYVKDVYTPVEGQGYGIGLIEPIVRLVLDINDQQNALNAAAALSVNPMVKCGDKFNIPDVQFEVSPGRVFRGEDIAQLQPFLLPDTTAIARMDKEELRRDIEEATLPRMLYGGETGGGDTATEFMGRRREANMKLRDKIVYTAENVLQPFLDMCFFNNQQFLDEKRVVRVSGDAASYAEYTVTPEELASVARVEVQLSPQLELLGMRGQMMKDWGLLFIQNAGMAQQWGIDLREMMRTAWLYQFGFDEVDKIFPDTMKPPTPQEEENLLMAMGEAVDVKPTDPHPAHAQQLVQFTTSPYFERLPEKIKALFEAHLKNHLMYLRQATESLPTGPMGAAGGPMAPGMGPGGPAPAPSEGVAMGRELAEEQRIGIQG